MLLSLFATPAKGFYFRPTQILTVNSRFRPLKATHGFMTSSIVLRFPHPDFSAIDTNSFLPPDRIEFGLWYLFRQRDAPI